MTDDDRKLLWVQTFTKLQEAANDLFELGHPTLADGANDLADRIFDVFKALYPLAVPPP